MRADQARKICSAEEYRLIRGATASEVSLLSAPQLRSAVARARRLLDKVRTLARKQRVAARHRGEGRSAENHKNTKARIALFEQALKRYEVALARAGTALRKAIKTKVKPGGKAKITAAARRPQPKAPASALLGRAGADGAPSPALSARTAAAAGRLTVRDLSRAMYSEKSKGQRLKNIYAGTANARIRGHARGAHRAAQAKRDAQQRGE